MRKDTVRSIISTIMAMLLLCSAFVLTACDGDDAKIKDDVAISALTAAAKGQIPNDNGYVSVDSDYFEFNFEALPTFKEADIFIASDSSANLNEVGIFHFSSTEDAKSGEQSIKNYLVAKDESFRNSINYTPDEYPKIENAKTKVIGNYVVYTILTAEDSAKVIDAIEAQLAE